MVLADINGAAAEASAAELNAEGGEAMAFTVDGRGPGADRGDGGGGARPLRQDRRAREQRRHRDPASGTRARRWRRFRSTEFDRMLAVNLKGVFLCSRAVVPHMKARGYGKIVNMSSGTFFNGRENLVHYVASKGGVIAFTRVLAREVGEWSITVNSIAPGLTASETEEHDIESFAIRIPNRAIKRIEMPEDLVGAAQFFMSSESDFISGQTLVVDGGVAVH